MNSDNSNTNREETILRITEHYVEALRRGEHPTLSEYITRYPDYAEDIADFIAYYHAIEIDIPEEISSNAVQPPDFHVAMNTAWERVEASNVSDARMDGATIETLLAKADKRGLSPIQVAGELDVSEDIVILIDQRRVQVSTIPEEMYRRLARTLQQPVNEVQAYFSRTTETMTQKVAESPTVYAAEIGQTEGDEYQISFRDVIEQSTHLSHEQKGKWLRILEQQGL